MRRAIVQLELSEDLTASIGAPAFDLRLVEILSGAFPSVDLEIIHDSIADDEDIDLPAGTSYWLAEERGPALWYVVRTDWPPPRLERPCVIYGEPGAVPVAPGPVTSGPPVTVPESLQAVATKSGARVNGELLWWGRDLIEWPSGGGDTYDVGWVRVGDEIVGWAPSYIRFEDRNDAAGADLEQSPGSLQSVAPMFTPQGEWCGLCDSNSGCTHPRMECRKCGAVGFAENMLDHDCRGKVKPPGVSP